MPSVNLRLFGPPSAQAPHGPEALHVGGAKPTALLVYLALEPGPHSRESLAALLWGDSTDEAARVSLRQALKHLRGGVGDAIRSDRSRVELVGPVECDVHEFREALRQDPTTAAWFDVPRFLCDFSVRNAPAFEEWAAETRQRLMDEYETVLRTLARGSAGALALARGGELGRALAGVRSVVRGGHPRRDRGVVPRG